MCICHLNRQDTLDGLLESLRRTPRVARAPALLVITSSKVGRSGKVAAIRQLAPLSVSHLINDHLDTVQEAYDANLGVTHIALPRRPWARAEIHWCEYFGEAAARLIQEKSSPTIAIAVCKG